ncbi:MAG: hypothetical protein ABGY95_00010 [Rubritalea sp.]|uniref:hypothetical protein n=1 Tax=Rubritalea sp. TaxID=2109375 RepID=UPI0032424B06
MLSAAISFIRQELGLRSIFYHTPQSGAAYTGSTAEDAPRSNYTKLPQKFCFSLSESRPSFAPKVKRKIPDDSFMHWAL